MDNRKYSCGIFIDLKRAFDTVNHDILLTKLEHYGIRGVIDSWFRSYLSDRRQSIEKTNAYLKLKRSYVECLKALYLDLCYFFFYISMTSINLPRNLLFNYSQMIQF